MITATMHEAKTNLSELVKKAQQGEKVVITSGREKTPMVELTPVKPVVTKRLGVLETPGFVIPESFWDDLPEEELALWYGDAE